MSTEMNRTSASHMVDILENYEIVHRSEECENGL